MKRYFSVVETVRNEYEYFTDEDEEKQIETYGVEGFLTSLNCATAWENLQPTLNQTLDYIETDWSTVQEEKW